MQPREYPAAELVEAREKFRRLQRQSTLLSAVLVGVAIVVWVIFGAQPALVVGGIAAMGIAVAVLSSMGYADATMRLIRQGGTR